jgi:hypothetical protein
MLLFLFPIIFAYRLRASSSVCTINSVKFDFDGWVCACSNAK